jgi:hypothetical protein
MLSFCFSSVWVGNTWLTRNKSLSLTKLHWNLRKYFVSNIIYQIKSQFWFILFYSFSARFRFFHFLSSIINLSASSTCYTMVLAIHKLNDIFVTQFIDNCRISDWIVITEPQLSKFIPTESISLIIFSDQKHI